MSIIESNKQQTNNSQRNAYQLTINNPLDYGFDHLTIKKTLVENFTTLRYFCMADEIGKEGTPHTHLYVYFNSRVRFSTVKKNFPSAHIEPAHGNIESNISYVKKNGSFREPVPVFLRRICAVSYTHLIKQEKNMKRLRVRPLMLPVKKHLT